MNEEIINQILKNQLSILNTLSNLAKYEIDRDNLYQRCSESEELLRKLNKEILGEKII